MEAWETGVVQIRVTPKTRNPFTIRALSISGVTRKWHFLNHAATCHQSSTIVARRRRPARGSRTRSSAIWCASRSAAILYGSVLHAVAGVERVSGRRHPAQISDYPGSEREAAQLDGPLPTPEAHKTPSWRSPLRGLARDHPVDGRREPVQRLRLLGKTPHVGGVFGVPAGPGHDIACLQVLSDPP
jgi:hypothetical protein